MPTSSRRGRRSSSTSGRRGAGPCKAIAPALEELSATTDKIEFVKLDIDANPETAQRFGVLSLPTVILFEGGEPRQSVFGARSKKHFEKSFSAYF